MLCVTLTRWNTLFNVRKLDGPVIRVIQVKSLKSHSSLSRGKESAVYSLLVDMCHSHVHRMDGGEDVCGSLNDTFPCLRHSDGGARGYEYRFVATAQRQVGEIMALD